jgi:hypothetical protein
MFLDILNALVIINLLEINSRSIVTRVTFLNLDI